MKVGGALYEATFGIRVDDRVYTGTAVGIDPYDAVANAYYAAKSNMRTAGGYISPHFFLIFFLIYRDIPIYLVGIHK